VNARVDPDSRPGVEPARRPGSLLGKWLAGILATVLSAAMVWWLTHPGGPLNPAVPPTSPAAVLRIVDVQVSGPAIAGRASAVVSLYNEGQATGEACTLWWYSGEKVAQQLDQGLEPSDATTSQPFGITPGQTRQISVESGAYSRPGMYRSFLEASCVGVDITSMRYYQDVVVTG